MTALLLGTVALGASCVAAEPYPVVAAAELHGDPVHGPLEVLGTGSRLQAEDDLRDGRTLAAYRVVLPDFTPRRVRIYKLDRCDPDLRGVPVLADLEEIRRVGGDTHFIATSIVVDGHLAEVDTETTHAEVSMVPGTRTYIIGQIAVVSALDAPDGSPGALEACGIFRNAPAP
jgi:hypothetical protein